MPVEFKNIGYANCGITTHEDVRSALRPELRNPSVREIHMMHVAAAPKAIAIAAPVPAFASLLLGMGFIAVAVDVIKGVYDKLIGKKS